MPRSNVICNIYFPCENYNVALFWCIVCCPCITLEVFLCFWSKPNDIKNSDDSHNKRHHCCHQNADHSNQEEINQSDN